MSAKQAGSASRQSTLNEAWLAKRAGETASTSGGASRSEPIYPAWYEEHLTEAQKKKFKEYAAAKVEASQARQSLASSSRHLVNAASIFREAQSNFHEADQEHKRASEVLAEKKRITENIGGCLRSKRSRERAKSGPYMKIDILGIGGTRE